MKKCPFCWEDIREEAIKCRYCSSLLIPLPTTVALPPSDKEVNDGQVKYVVDKGLISFAKFAVATLAIFVTCGAYLFGFKVEEEAKTIEEKAKTLQITVDQTRLLQDNAVKINAGMQSTRDEIQKTSDAIFVLLAQTKQNAQDVSSQKDYVYTLLSQHQVTNINVASSRGASIQASSARLYTELELLALLKGDAAKATAYFRAHGVELVCPVMISKDKDLQNVYLTEQE